MASPVNTPSASGPVRSTWQRLAPAFMRGFHAYAGWLVTISWWRFALLALLLLIGSGILQSIPPFSWQIAKIVDIESDAPADAEPRKPSARPAPPAQPAPAASPAPAREPGAAPDQPAPPAPPSTAASRAGDKKLGVEIQIGQDGIQIKRAQGTEVSVGPNGVHIKKDPARQDAAPAAASGPAAAAASGEVLVDIRIPPGKDAEGVKEAMREAIETAREAVEDAIREAEEAKAEQAQGSADEAARDLAREARALKTTRQRIVKTRLGDFLPDLAFLWIIASLIIKITYKGQLRAEAQAAQATETAESESLKRQVTEARLAAMQAQIEPHFLFNTLASIDHLIETDPPRASRMQKNLIALLRASMPNLRETGPGGRHDLGRELAVIRPYLEILQVRMEDRLQTDVRVPDGLLSAEFPPLVLQSLVENAIKHGLEPKAEGGSLVVQAEIIHGKLALSVRDTGLGFGKAATAGTGTGLTNIRERLQLLYGKQASLTIAETPGGGTTVTVSLPYKPVEGDHSPRTGAPS